MTENKTGQNKGLEEPSGLLGYVAVATRAAMRVRPLYTRQLSADVDAAICLAIECCKGDFPGWFAEEKLGDIADAADQAGEEARGQGAYPSAFAARSAAFAARAARAAVHTYKVSDSKEFFDRRHRYNAAGWAYESACEASFLVPPPAGAAIMMSANAIASYYDDPEAEPADFVRNMVNADSDKTLEISQRRAEMGTFQVDPVDPTPTGPLGPLWEAYPEWWLFDDSGVGQHSLVIYALESGILRVEMRERFGQLPLSEGSAEVAAHGLMLPSLFLEKEIEEFDRLLNMRPPATEEVFQRFFEENPKWIYLLGEQYERAVPQVRMPRMEVRQTLGFVDGKIHNSEMLPDFMLKRINLDLWDVLDLKRASFRTVVGGSSRRKFSASVHSAVAQLQEYTERLRQDSVREHLRRNYDITVVRPVAMVVIGRDFDFRTLREKDTLRESNAVRVYTYDDIRRLAVNRSVRMM